MRLEILKTSMRRSLVRRIDVSLRRPRSLRAAFLADQGLTTIPTPRPRGSEPVCRRVPSTRIAWISPISQP